VCIADKYSALPVPAGTFWIGDPAVAPPAHKVTLDAFDLGKFEVTAKGYKTCVDAGTCAVPSCSETYGKAGKESNPVVCVTWFQARDYCKRLGAD
jgi:formylglycine-generating enzyme required for sulfatase activity